MRPPRVLTIVPLLVLTLLAWVTAPFAVARCEHACGAIRMHLIGASCDDGDHCPDQGTHSGKACGAIDADAATTNAPSPELPPPMATPAPSPVIAPLFVPLHGTRHIPPILAPPLRADEIAGPGARPLLI